MWAFARPGARFSAFLSFPACLSCPLKCVGERAHKGCHYISAGPASPHILAFASLGTSTLPECAEEREKGLTRVGSSENRLLLPLLHEIGDFHCLLCLVETSSFFQERAWGAGPTPPQGDRKGTPLPRPGAASVAEGLPNLQKNLPLRGEKGWGLA